ncbi:MAG: hypothetical protein KGH94_03895 [Candidatus Micrarchaeota archaeon]|nr:hypothetical protein [Candidatus Micrarchaeota archaeon]
MPGELLEAYRRLEQRQYIMAVCITVSTLVTLVVLILYSQLAGISAKSAASYLSIANNYSTLSQTYNSRLASLTSSLSNLSERYNQTFHNLTTPYVQQLYSNYQVNIPGSIATSPSTITNQSGPIETFNSTYVTRYFSYNFSFNAPYGGYITLNATGTSANTQTNSTWEFLISNGHPLLNGTLYYYNFEAGSYSQGEYAPTVTSRGTYKTSLNLSQPLEFYAPLPSQADSSTMIPVGNGTVRVWIVNLANQSASVTFSAAYTGFRNR